MHLCCIVSRAHQHVSIRIISRLVCCFTVDVLSDQHGTSMINAVLSSSLASTVALTFQCLLLCVRVMDSIVS